MTMLLVTDEDQEEENEPLPDLLSHSPKDGSVGVILSDTLTTQYQIDRRQVLGQYAGLFSLTPCQTT